MQGDISWAYVKGHLDDYEKALQEMMSGIAPGNDQGIRQGLGLALRTFREMRELM